MRFAVFVLGLMLSAAPARAAEMLAMLGVRTEMEARPVVEPLPDTGGALPTGEWATYALSGKKVGFWWEAGSANTKVQNPVTLGGRRCYHVSVNIDVVKGEPQKQHWQIYADIETGLVVKTEVKKTSVTGAVFEEYVDHFDHRAGTVRRDRKGGSETKRYAGGTMMVAMWLPFHLRLKGHAGIVGAHKVVLVNDPTGGALAVNVTKDSKGFTAKSPRIEIKLDGDSLQPSTIWISGMFSATVKLERN